jgi:hypothetical protein
LESLICLNSTRETTEIVWPHVLRTTCLCSFPGSLNSRRGLAAEKPMKTLLEFEYMRLEKKDKLARVTVTRERYLNAMNNEATIQLNRLAMALREDPDTEMDFSVPSVLIFRGCFLFFTHHRVRPHGA